MCGDSGASILCIDKDVQTFIFMTMFRFIIMLFYIPKRQYLNLH